MFLFLLLVMFGVGGLLNSGIGHDNGWGHVHLAFLFHAAVMNLGTQTNTRTLTQWHVSVW